MAWQAELAWMLSQETPRVLMQLGRLLKATIARFAASATIGGGGTPPNMEERQSGGQGGERVPLTSLSSAAADRLRLGSLGRRPRIASSGGMYPPSAGVGML